MIVCVSGLSGCGKNTVGKIIAEKLRFRQIKFSFKDEAARRGLSLMEFQKLARENDAIDKEFDEHLKKEAAKGDCVITTWLGSWIVEGVDFRVWLDASDEVRAKRVSERDEMSFDEALEHVRKRDDDNISRYKKVYGIDIMDHEGFDLVADANTLPPEKIAEEIMSEINAKFKR